MLFTRRIAVIGATALALVVGVTATPTAASARMAQLDAMLTRMEDNARRRRNRRR